MNDKSQSNHFSTRAKNYDRLQPVRVEMYDFYHQLALDFMPFDTQDDFRMLDLGCGTGTFLNNVLDHYPNATCVAIDYSDEILKFAAHKVRAHSDRVSFHQEDLNQELPNSFEPFQLVASFSALHHLTDKNKVHIFKQIYEMLEEGGWFFFIDAMSIRFDDNVFNLGRKRSQMHRQKRFKAAGIDIEEDWQVREMDAQVDKNSPEKDRISSLSSQITWLKEAGFRSVDHIWHFWMEHFIICRK